MSAPERPLLGANHLFYGDNLRVLRDSIQTETIDLIYLDPPFNSNAGYNILFKGPEGSTSAAQIEAFDEVLRGSNAAATTTPRAMRHVSSDDDKRLRRPRHMIAPAQAIPEKRNPLTFSKAWGLPN